MKNNDSPDKAEFVWWALSQAAAAVLNARESEVMSLRYDASGSACLTLQ